MLNTTLNHYKYSPQFWKDFVFSLHCDVTIYPYCVLNTNMTRIQTSTTEAQDSFLQLAETSTQHLPGSWEFSKSLFFLSNWRCTSSSKCYTPLCPRVMVKSSCFKKEIRSNYKYLLRAYYVSSAVLGAEDTTLSKGQIPALRIQE